MSLTQARQVRASRRLSQPQSVGSPTLGWNTRDPYEAMEPLDAITLDNWYPTFGGVVVRNGTLSYATEMGTGAVETLATLQTMTVNKFIAACDGKLYDISTGGIAGSPIASGFGSSRWETAVFQNHLFFVNGDDVAQKYDGTTVTVAAFTGVATSTLSGVGVFHNRLYFWSGVNASFWYGPVNGIAGALANFDLSTVSHSGGNLIAVDVLTYDGGLGIASYTCFFMSSGEVLVYQGTDPSNASNWSLVGAYTLSPPIAARAIFQFGGDIYIATQTDHFQLTKIMIALKLGQTPTPTKISGAATAAFNAVGNIFGWEAIYYPRGTRIIFNVPNEDGSFSQHVYNTSLSAWTRFNDMNAHTWGVYNDRLYFGKSLGEVVLADTGVVDSDNTGSRPIVAKSQQAWQSFGTPLAKRLAASRVVVQTNNSGASYEFDVGIDYQLINFQTPIAAPPQGALWGSVTWGAFVWSGAPPTQVDVNWRIQGGEGLAFSWGVVANSQASTLWIKTDLLLEPGAAL